MRRQLINHAFYIKEAEWVDQKHLLTDLSHLYSLQTGAGKPAAEGITIGKLSGIIVLIIGRAGETIDQVRGMGEGTKGAIITGSRGHRDEGLQVEAARGLHLEQVGEGARDQDRAPETAAGDALIVHQRPQSHRQSPWSKSRKKKPTKLRKIANWS